MVPRKRDNCPVTADPGSDGEDERNSGDDSEGEEHGESRSVMSPPGYGLPPHRHDHLDKFTVTAGGGLWHHDDHSVLKEPKKNFGGASVEKTFWPQRMQYWSESSRGPGDH